MVLRLYKPQAQLQVLPCLLSLLCCTQLYHTRRMQQ